MNELIQLVVFESKSLPQGYKALEDLGEMGLEPLEFYPHAQGIRILFKMPAGFSKSLPTGTTVIPVSIKILKAILSQTSNNLKKFLVVVETRNYSELLKLATAFEKIDADILELRSLRSNTEKNYGLFTVDSKESAAQILNGIDHSILSATSAVLKEFLGFK